MHLIALLGQTCSGKSEMAVELAKYLGSACVINCDSRQIYKGLDLGTAKVQGGWVNDVYNYKDVQHYLIDYVDPALNFNLSNYISDFIKLIESFKKMPNPPKYLILTGGTGLYAKAIIEKLSLGEVDPEKIEEFNNYKITLNSQSLQTLQQECLEIGIQADFNNSDWHNKPRLISRLVNQKSKQEGWLKDISYPEFETVGSYAIKLNDNFLQQRVVQRILDRIDQGMIQEIDSFRYLPAIRFSTLGLEYRYGLEYLLGKLSLQEFVEKLSLETCRYAKRQKTWFKKQNLLWIDNLNDLVTDLNSKITI